MKLEEAINKLEELSQYESVVEDHEEAISTALQHIEHLQKENKDLKTNLYRVNDNNVKHLVFIRELQLAQKNSVRKEKIRKLIENETLDIAGFECIAVEDLQDLLKEE